MEVFNDGGLRVDGGDDDDDDGGGRMVLHWAHSNLKISETSWNPIVI